MYVNRSAVKFSLIFDVKLITISFAWTIFNVHNLNKYRYSYFITQPRTIFSNTCKVFLFHTVNMYDNCWFNEFRFKDEFSIFQWRFYANLNTQIGNNPLKSTYNTPTDFKLKDKFGRSRYNGWARDLPAQASTWMPKLFGLIEAIQCLKVFGEKLHLTRPHIKNLSKIQIFGWKFEILSEWVSKQLHLKCDVCKKNCLNIFIVLNDRKTWKLFCKLESKVFCVFSSSRTPIHVLIRFFLHFYAFSLCSVKTDLMESGANSTLFIAKVRKTDTGNYTCSIGPNDFYTINVQVLNGNLPAFFFNSFSFYPLFLIFAGRQKEKSHSNGFSFAWYFSFFIPFASSFHNHAH